MARRTKSKPATLSALLLFSSVIHGQAPDTRTPSNRTCQLVSANPSKFDPFPYLPKVLDFTKLNRFPKVAYVVNEDGSVSNVKIIKGTGSPKLDAALVKSIQTWKYKPQLGCRFEMSMGIIIDIGPS